MPEAQDTGDGLRGTRVRAARQGLLLLSVVLLVWAVVSRWRLGESPSHSLAFVSLAAGLVAMNVDAVTRRGHLVWLGLAVVCVGAAFVL